VNILILGLNYAPEPVGIGPYTTGMAESLATAGHRVTVVCGKPYYPHWQVERAYRGLRARRSDEGGVSIVRLPLYVPRDPNGPRRLLHHASFAARALPKLLAEARRVRPDVIIAIAPSLFSAGIARVVAKTVGAKLWLHVQDFEVDAAFATGLLADNGIVSRAARAFERWSLAGDRISAISPQMCDRLRACGVASERIVEFRNWATLAEGAPSTSFPGYRAEWGLDRPHVALYAGSIANKQGIDLIVDAARQLSHRHDLVFLVCGDGPQRARLAASAAHLDNIQFRALQPQERLSELLDIASVHLLPQIAGAADLLLPSKLTNMLFSGRPVVVTAARGTGLAAEVEGCGEVVDPGNSGMFARAIERLIDDPALRSVLGGRARERAEERWSRTRILDRFERQLCELAA
jgi:colanic acid biosynthesis glycosyl transferase WcaI